MEKGPETYTRKGRIWWEGPRDRGVRVTYSKFGLQRRMCSEELLLKELGFGGRGTFRKNLGDMKGNVKISPIIKGLTE